MSGCACWYIVPSLLIPSHTTHHPTLTHIRNHKCNSNTIQLTFFSIVNILRSRYFSRLTFCVVDIYTVGILGCWYYALATFCAINIMRSWQFCFCRHLLFRGFSVDILLLPRFIYSQIIVELNIFEKLNF
jgi:hypothetical protein